MTGTSAAKVLSFPGFEPEVIQGGAKLTKAGAVKKTHSNAKAGRSTWVEPITDLDDVYKVIDYLQSKIDRERRPDYRKAWARNKLYFCIGVFSGFRVSDLLNLTWQDVFEADGTTYRKEVGIKEKKTGKIKELYTTTASRKYIDEYLRMYHPDTTKADYIFTNRQGEQLGAHSVTDFIKEATKAVGLQGNYNTHTIRKTYAYQYYIVMANEGDAFALAEVQDMLNHLNTQTTLRYLGMDKQRRRTNMQKFAEAMERSQAM